MDFKADAAVRLIPKGSQIAIFALIICSVIFFGYACWLYAHTRPFVLPLCGSVVLLLIGSAFWLVAHKNESLSQSHPTVFGFGDGESKVIVSSDGRSVPTLNYLRDLISHYQATFHRQPLPPASGVIDDQGCPVSGSENVARKLNDKANQQGQQMNSDLFDDALSKLANLATTESSPVIADALEKAECHQAHSNASITR
ncbi:hypothetical protein [Pseudomonas alabamensis]|uniref:hypothetical protein n=1 Tax=Pseudomonas alabamensis TaxID=3064349 RepID=UPI003F64ECDC